MFVTDHARQDRRSLSTRTNVLLLNELHRCTTGQRAHIQRKKYTEIQIIHGAGAVNYPPLFPRRFCRVSPRPNALLCAQNIPKTHRRCACVRVRVRLPYLMYCDSSHAIQGNVGQMRGCFLYVNTLALKTVKVFHAVCRMQSRRVCPLPYLARIKRQPATRASRRNAISFP